MSPEIKVSEVFQSIQGEGLHAGKAMTFVRLSPDAPPTLFSKVIDDIEKLALKDVCFVGPLTPNLPGVINLSNTLLDSSFRVHLEFDASEAMTNIPNAVSKTMEIYCPEARTNREALAWENLILLRKADQVKFVVASRSDFNWAKRVCEENDLYERCGVFFSPARGKLSARDLAAWILAPEQSSPFSSGSPSEIQPDKESP